MASTLIAMASNLMHIVTRIVMHIASHGVMPKSHGHQPNSDGFQPRGEVSKNGNKRQEKLISVDNKILVTGTLVFWSFDF